MLQSLTEQLATSGGPVLIALAILSIAALATTIFKITHFFQLGMGRYRAARLALAHWQKGNHQEAVASAANGATLSSRVLHTAFSAITKSTTKTEKAVEEQAVIHFAGGALSKATSHLLVLEAVVQAAPMLGLLGTVIGMIEAFSKLSQTAGAIDPTILAGGIWIALTTTAVGLTIAIPFYFASLWFESRIQKEKRELEIMIHSVFHDIPHGA